LPVRRLHDLHVAHGVGQQVSFRVIRAIAKRKKLKVAFLDAIAHERQRLGDDLHDGLGQELTGLSLLLSAIVRSTRRGDIVGVTDLERALELAQHALESCRSIARGMSPVTETQGGLIAGLRELVGRLKTQSGPALDFAVTGMMTRLELSQAASDHLYRIAQEALANALRHARANLIKVTLDIAPASVRLEIFDDGEGLTVPGFGTKGLGLRTMRYRASLLGSKLQIKRRNPVGTRIVCETRNAADSEPIGAPVINPRE
jgi:signal transduction histidine kinase